jgi:uncharacterized membrane protein
LPPGIFLTDLKRTSRNLRSNLIAGVLTIIPLIVVWVVLDFIFSFLFAVGSPVEQGISLFVMHRMPQAAPLLENTLFHWFVAVVLALMLLYSVGAVASRMVGKRLIAGIEGLIARIPVVETVYSASKKLVGILEQKPDGAARVVLLEFPTPGMRAIGLVMRVFNDAITGEELAAVYVPTTPNPTSGYLEILPVKSLVPTSMTMDQAMTMIVSGGAVAPENLTITPALHPTR